MTETDVLESGIRRQSKLASHNIRNEHFRLAAEGTWNTTGIWYFTLVGLLLKPSPRTLSSSHNSGLEVRVPVQVKSTFKRALCAWIWLVTVLGKKTILFTILFILFAGNSGNPVPRLCHRSQPLARATIPLQSLGILQSHSSSAWFSAK